MKRTIASAGRIVLIGTMVLAAVFVVGCSKQDDSAATSTTATTPTGAIPGNPYATPATANRRPAAGAPTASNANPTGKPVTAAKPPADPSAPLQFSAVPLKSAVSVVSTDMGGAKLKSLRFKYQDCEGKVCSCEIPEDETKTTRTLGEWTSTFDLYKKSTPTPTTKHVVKKQSVKRLNDFPFVSPPSGGNANKQQPGFRPGMPGFSPGMPYGRR